MDAAARRAIVQQLLVDHQLDEGAVEERARCCTSAGYWTSLCPGQSIGARATPLEEVTSGPGASSDAAGHIRGEGYGAVPVFLPQPVLARLNGVIEAVNAAGWPSVFAWVFDDFWSAARTTAVRSVAHLRRASHLHRPRDRAVRKARAGRAAIPPARRSAAQGVCLSLCSSTWSAWNPSICR